MGRSTEKVELMRTLFSQLIEKIICLESQPRKFQFFLQIFGVLTISYLLHSAVIL